MSEVGASGPDADGVSGPITSSGVEGLHAEAGDGCIVAAFDMDGTLSDGHSLLDFATALAGRRGTAAAIAVALVRAGVPPRRAAFKEAMFGRILAGRAEADVRATGERLAREIVDRRLRPDAIAALDAHRAVGHELVLVTAALDVYVDAVAELLGVDAVISTRVEVRDGGCTGHLIDGDLHDERKVERLREWLGPRAEHAEVYAYGNSEDDEEMIRYAESTRRHPPRSGFRAAEVAGERAAG